MQTIEIKGKKYNVKSTVRAIFMFEEAAGHSFKLTNTLESFLYFWCILYASNRNDNPPTWDEFIDIVDEDPGVITRIDSALKKSGEVDSMLGSKEEEEGDGKKKE